ncbi:MAG: hypothetical protein R2864_11175 [Syntrophotaleaceae bacterium]
MNLYSHPRQKLATQERLPRQRIHLAFVGYGDELSQSVIELTRQLGAQGALCHRRRLRSHRHRCQGYLRPVRQAEIQVGGNVVRERGRWKHGTTHIAFIDVLQRSS